MHAPLSFMLSSSTIFPGLNNIKSSSSLSQDLCLAISLTNILICSIIFSLKSSLKYDVKSPDFNITSFVFSNMTL